MLIVLVWGLSLWSFNEAILVEPVNGFNYSTILDKRKMLHSLTQAHVALMCELAQVGLHTYEPKITFRCPGEDSICGLLQGSQWHSIH